MYSPTKKICNLGLTLNQLFLESALIGSRTLTPREPEYYVRGLWNIAPDLLTTRLKGHNTQVTEYSWFQLYMLHLVGKSPDSLVVCKQWWVVLLLQGGMGAW